MHLSQVSPSYVYSFEIYVLTNKHTYTHKQTLLKTSNALRYATTFGNGYYTLGSM